MRGMKVWAQGWMWKMIYEPSGGLQWRETLGRDDKSNHNLCLVTTFEVRDDAILKMERRGSEDNSRHYYSSWCVQRSPSVSLAGSVLMCGTCVCVYC